MKTYSHLYEKIYSFDNLFLAYLKARKRKTTRNYVLQFEEALIINLVQLHQELKNETYHPAPLKTFILRDPKTRKISVSEFRDRIVHHALCNVIEPLFERTFIYDSYANRKGKGTREAIKRFDFFKRKVSHNGTIIRKHPEEKLVRGFVFKADIKHYFERVDHQVLLSIIKRKITDKKTIILIQKILDNYLGKEPHTGMPLGNLTSQFFANVYLNELDNFVKHKLNAKYYLRYVDDFVILHQDREILSQYFQTISSFLKEKLLLELHPQKSMIIPLNRGISFLGLKIFYHHKLIPEKNRHKFFNKYTFLREMFHSKEINYDSIYDFIEGWVIYAKEANSHNLRGKILNKFEHDFCGEISTKEINRAQT